MSGRLICIVGPTASGKSELAEAVAERLGGEVVSIDAMQVYRGMDIGTAKTPPEQRRVKLHMVDVADVGEDYSVQRFQADARACIDGLAAHGTAPVLCGGTGLYLNAVIDEMVFPAGSRGTETRAAYEELANEIGPDALHARLAELDPDSAELIHPNNVRRVVRALELLDEGKSYATHHAGLHERAVHYPSAIYGLSWPREMLYARIEARVDSMLELGLIAEVEGLMARGLERDTTAGQAIGYKECMDYLEGVCTLEEAVATIKQRTRRYAKRQLSWFGHDGRVSWIDMESRTLESAADEILAKEARHG